MNELVCANDDIRRSGDVAARLPRARRVGGRDRTVLVALAGVAAVLTAALVYLLVSGSIFSSEPRTDLERDYQMLLTGLNENPDDPAILMTLAEVEYEMGKKADAFDHAAAAIKVAEEQPFYNLRHATLLVREDRLADAEKSLEAEIEITGTTKPEPYFLLAQVQAQSDRLEDAIDTMEQGLIIDPAAADMGIVYGRLLEDAGRNAEAVEAYEKALRFLPGNEDAIAGLERLGVTYVEPTSTPDPHGSPEGQ